MRKTEDEVARLKRLILGEVISIRVRERIIRAGGPGEPPIALRESLSRNLIKLRAAKARRRMAQELARDDAGGGLRP